MAPAGQDGGRGELPDWASPKVRESQAATQFHATLAYLSQLLDEPAPLAAFRACLLP